MSVDLSHTEIGTGSGPSVIILHGLFGQGRNWAMIARGLAETHRVFSVDMRNHGDSPWDDEMTYPAMADDVARLIETQDRGPAMLIGHSLGGKATMTLAMQRPELVERACIVDIAPVPYDHDFETHLEAMLGLDLASIKRRGEAEARLRETLNDPHLAGFLIRNLSQDVDGGFRWRVNLAALADHMDDLLDFPIFEADQAYDGPALFLAGGASTYVRSYHQAEIERLFPNAEIEIIEGAGHWPHADDPNGVIARLRPFLAAATG